MTILGSTFVSLVPKLEIYVLEVKPKGKTPTQSPFLLHMTGLQLTLHPGVSETYTQHHGAELRWVPLVAVIKRSNQKKLGRSNGLFGFKSEPEVEADDVGTQSLVPPSFSSSGPGGRERSHSHWARSFYIN